MDLNRLPFLPLNFFYHQFSHDTKRWFWVGMVTLVAAVAFMLFAFHNPTYWSMEVQEVSDTSLVEVNIGEVTRDYRSFPLDLNAYQQYVSFSGGPLLPHHIPTYLFMFFQVLGWSLFLAAVSMIRAKWGYAFYFGFALFFHFSGITTALFPALAEGSTAMQYGVELLLIAPLLGLAGLFQMNMLKWAFGVRFLVMFLILGAYIGISWNIGGWEVLHRMAGDSFPLLLIISCLFLFFLGKDPTNLIMAGATNRRDPRTRLSIWVILAALILWLVAALLMANPTLGLPWLPKGLGGLSPLHIVGFMAVATIFLSQNQFHFVESFMSTNLVFTMVLISVGIISMSHMALLFSQGDLLHIHWMEEYAAIFFLFVALGHVLYLFLNYSTFIKDKINLYYLMTQSPLLPFFMVWLIGMIGWTINEGRSDWVVLNRFHHSIYTQWGDQAYLQNDQALALSNYQLAVRAIDNSVKARYNLGGLSFAATQDPNEAIAHYRKIAHFPYATINAANLLRVYNRVFAGQEMLRDHLAYNPHPQVANNLAILYLQQGAADSAIVNLKRALWEDIDLSAAYSNLGLVYLENNKQEEAGRFLQQAIETPSVSTAALANSLMFQLLSNSLKPVSEAKIASRDDYLLRFNKLLVTLKQQGITNSQTELSALAADDLSADAMIMDAYRLLLQDSTKYATSRVDYVNQLFPDAIGHAYYMLGVAYFQRGLPEMARLYFDKSGQKGKAQGYLDAAKMELDLGRRDTAFAHLNDIVAKYDLLRAEASKELDLLLFPYLYGEMNTAMAGVLTHNPTREDLIRGGQYADSLKGYGPALELFRRVIAMDSSDVAPFLEMGRIYNRYGDTLALENLTYGLQLDPADKSLRTELAMAYIRQGNAREAGKWLDSLTSEPEILLQTALAKSDWFLLTQDTTAAIELLEGLYQTHKLNQELVIRLARLYDLQNDYDKGNQLMVPAVDENTENPMLWLYYARFSQAWSQDADAAYGARRAISLSTSEAFTQAVKAEFDTLL